MVQVVKADRGPLVHIHFIERHVAGNGTAVTVYGELKIAAKEYIYAREFKLKTIQVLSLTSETGTHTAYHPQKYIHAKGEWDNYASIDIFTVTTGSVTEMTAGTGPTTDGSLWLDFIAIGE